MAGHLWHVRTLCDTLGGGAKMLLEVVLVRVSPVLQMCVAKKSREIKINYYFYHYFHIPVPLLLRLISWPSRTQP